ncbi:MAG: hypothetical protein LBT80_04860 [Lactobacillaceae bacterium]|jgi:hypothetical protein|nr:hypothetical protein [Lactobacillaceae bacterium]
MNEANNKAALLENLRQVTDTLTRLTARRRRLRAQRRVMIARMKGMLVIILSAILVAITAAVAIMLLPWLPLESIAWVLAVEGVLFVVTLGILIKFACMTTTRYAKFSWVKKKMAPTEKTILRLEMEISSLLNAEFLETIPMPANLIDCDLVREACAMVSNDCDVTWNQICNALQTERELKRIRRQSTFASEWHRVYGAIFPNRSSQVQLSN